LYLPSRAQIYVKGYAGYSFSTGNEKLTSYETYDSRSDSRISETSYKMGFGEGLNPGASIGYQLNKNIAFELTGNMQLFSRFSYSNPSKWFPDNPPMDESYQWAASGFFGDAEYENQLFQFSPQVVFQLNPYRKWTFYLKAGPDFLLIKSKQTLRSISRDFQYDSHLPSYLTTNEYSGNINTGIQSSFGIEYGLSKNISAFIELTAVYARYTFKERKILRYEIDGIDAISELQTTTFNNNTKTDYSHTGLNIGLKYIFR
jgi:opacity protein-like surface antigen